MRQVEGHGDGNISVTETENNCWLPELVIKWLLSFLSALVLLCLYMKCFSFLLHLDDESILLELPYEVSAETSEYGLAPERCTL